MTTLPEIAAEARRMARYQLRMACAFEPDSVGERTARQAAADFDRLAEMAEPKPMTGMQMGVPMAGVPMKGLES